MLTSMIVDDERLSIRRLKEILVSFGNVEVIGTYTDGFSALEAISNEQPNLLFLDINLPGELGIDIAKKVKNEYPDVQIIFVTAHEEYALKAFEIGVLDYVLKPYDIDRIRQVLNKIDVTEIPKKDEFTIHAFKYFHIKMNGKEIKNIKWRTSKSRELFIYLVQHSEEIIRKDVLLDIFWPDTEVKSAYDNLYTTIYQLRKTLDDIGLNLKIINSNHGYEVVFNDVKYDVIEWMRLIHVIEREFFRLKDSDFELILENYAELKALYKGHYLSEESSLWKENLKEQYMIMFFSISQQVINELERRELYTDAVLNTLHLQKLYPYVDYSYFMLMRLYGRVGDRYNVERHYESLKNMLESEFGTLPNKVIKEWYKNWITNQYTT